MLHPDYFKNKESTGFWSKSSSTPPLVRFKNLLDFGQKVCLPSLSTPPPLVVQSINGCSRRRVYVSPGSLEISWLPFDLPEMSSLQPLRSPPPPPPGVIPASSQEIMIKSSALTGCPVHLQFLRSTNWQQCIVWMNIVSIDTFFDHSIRLSYVVEVSINNMTTLLLIPFIAVWLHYIISLPLHPSNPRL